MPKLSYFHGITITMHWDEPHHYTPHFHALYGEHEASLDLQGEVIAGELPKSQLRLVQAYRCLSWNSSLLLLLLLPALLAVLLSLLLRRHCLGAAGDGDGGDVVDFGAVLGDEFGGHL